MYIYRFSTVCWIALKFYGKLENLHYIFCVYTILRNLRIVLQQQQQKLLHALHAYLNGSDNENKILLLQNFIF